MVDNGKQVRKQILDVIGCLGAVVTIIAYVLLCINAKWTFIQADSFVMNVLKIIQTYAPLIVVCIVGLEFCSDKNIVIRIIFYLMIVLVVIFTCFPSTWTEIVGLID